MTNDPAVPTPRNREGFPWLEPLHSMGERLLIESDALRQALAWQVAVELIRRHPDTLRLSMAFIHQYGPALVTKQLQAGGKWHPVHLMTWGKGAHITLDGLSSSGAGGQESRFNWLDVLLAPNRRDYVVAGLERQAGLTPPRSTPATTRQSIGIRLVSAFLAKTALAPTMRWVAVNGLIEDDDGDSPAGDLFAAIPALYDDWIARRASPDEWSTSRYWFILPNDEESAGYDRPPVAALDFISGALWTAEGKTHDLMADYAASGRRLDPLVSHLLPPTQ